MIHGILVINKERGLTSHQVVANLRRIIKQSRVGHTGTLDPEATGVLVVGLGEATRSFQFLNENMKVYRAEIILGQVTDTQDSTGRVLEQNLNFTLRQDQIKGAIAKLTGETDQLPPMYSAVKVNGRKMYELARQGLEVERRTRKINVFNWESSFTQEQYSFKDSFTVEISCSKGTYIRTLIHDLGAILGCGAHMGSLIRVKAGNFSLENAITVSEVEHFFNAGQLEEKLVSLNVALSHLPALSPDQEDIKKVINGGKISAFKYSLDIPCGGYARVLDSDFRVIAILSLQETDTYKFWQPVKVFHKSDRANGC